MLVTMTDRELYRLGIIQRVFDRALLQLFMDDATGRLMHLRFCDSENAFDYMMATQQYIDNKRYRELGPAGLVSQRRGKPGNHQLNTAIRDQTLQFIRTRGRGMNPSAICFRINAIITVHRHSLPVMAQKTRRKEIATFTEW